jgi:hypothetical protein
MPETPIHENGDPSPPENEIGPAKNVLVPAPSGYFGGAEQFYKGEFGIPVAATSYS